MSIADVRCSISNIHSTDCGYYERYPEDRSVLQLDSCRKDISSHLRALKLSGTLNDVKSEADLICRRVGLFTTNASLTVCPFHRYKLGLDFRQGRTCSHHLHVGKGKTFRGLNSYQSQRILQEYGVLVPFGSGVCYQCYRSLPKPDSGFDLNTQDVKEDESVPVDGLSPSRKTEDAANESNITDLFLNSQTQSLSQGSSWSQENMETYLSDLNKGIDIISGGSSSPIRFQVRSDLRSLKPSTKRVLKRKAISVIDTVLNGIAPGQSMTLFTMIQDKESGTENSSELQEIIVKLYTESTDRSTKRQLLSMIAMSHSRKDLQQLIPGLTVYAINEARKHAKNNGQGAKVPKELPFFRHKMDKDKPDHALDFFFSPSFHQVSSFGEKEMKLDNGSSVVIPEVVRTVCHATLINTYINCIKHK